MENIYLIGMMGCGKTSVGRRLAERLNMDFLDMDAQIEKKEGKSISAIFADKGEEYFRKTETRYLKEACKSKNTVISTGGGIVTVPENIEIMQKSGSVVWIVRDIDETLKKVRSDKRPLMQKGDANFKELYDKRRPIYMSACKYIILNNADVETCAQRIIKAVK